MAAGGFLREFGSEPDGELARFRAEWRELSEAVLPESSRPDEARKHFFQFSRRLDSWVRHWGAVADSRNDERLRVALSQAQTSLGSLLQEAKQLYRTPAEEPAARVEERRRRQFEQLEAQRRAAEHQAALRRSEEEIAAIYEAMRRSRRESNARHNALWFGSQFPDISCACGKSKLPNHLWCYDCANRFGRTRL